MYGCLYQSVADIFRERALPFTGLTITLKMWRILPSSPSTLCLQHVRASHRAAHLSTTLSNWKLMIGVFVCYWLSFHLATLHLLMCCILKDKRLVIGVLLELHFSLVCTEDMTRTVCVPRLCFPLLLMWGKQNCVILFQIGKAAPTSPTKDRKSNMGSPHRNPGSPMRRNSRIERR